MATTSIEISLFFPTAEFSTELRDRYALRVVTEPDPIPLGLREFRKAIEVLSAIHHFRSHLLFPDGSIIIDVGVGRAFSTIGLVAAHAEALKNIDIIGIDNGSSPDYRDEFPRRWAPDRYVHELVSGMRNVVLLDGDIWQLGHFLRDKGQKVTAMFIFDPPKDGFTEPLHPRKNEKAVQFLLQAADNLAHNGRILIIGRGESRLEAVISREELDSVFKKPRIIKGKKSYDLPPDQLSVSLIKRIIEMVGTDGETRLSRSDLERLVGEIERSLPESERLRMEETFGELRSSIAQLFIEQVFIQQLINSEEIQASTYPRLTILEKK